MKTLKTILIISLSVLFTLIFAPKTKDVEATPVVVIESDGISNADLASATIQGGPDYEIVNTSDDLVEADADVWYDENPDMLDDLYWQQDFLRDCMAEGDYKVSYHPCGLYSQAMKVIDKGTDYIVFENCNGFQYIVNEEPQDVGLNEIYSCIMYDNKTGDSVLDDIIVTYNYDRVDVWF